MLFRRPSAPIDADFCQEENRHIGSDGVCADHRLSSQSIGILIGRILSFGRRALLEVGQSLSVLVSSELFGDREDSTLF